MFNSFKESFKKHSSDTSKAATSEKWSSIDLNDESFSGPNYRVYI